MSFGIDEHVVAVVVVVFPALAAFTAELLIDFKSLEAGAGGPLKKQLNTSLLPLWSMPLFRFESLSAGFDVGDDRPSKSELNVFDSMIMVEVTAD